MIERYRVTAALVDGTVRLQVRYDLRNRSRFADRAELQLDLLVQLSRHLAHHALESRQDARERHHARAHQPFLQLAVDA